MTTRAKDLNTIIFAHPFYLKSTILTEAALQLTKRMPGFRVAAICDSGNREPPSRFERNSLRLAETGLARLFNPSDPIFFERDELASIYTAGRRHRVDVIVPRDRDINHPEFIAHLRDELEPNLALSLGCPQIFRNELIDIFDSCVNSHDGILPDYRGWRATEWSIYCGESETGHTYHYLTEKVDEGPILNQITVPIGMHSAMRLRHEKAKQAASQLESVIRAVATAEPGTPQIGESKYFVRRDLKALTKINEPDRVDWLELERRLRSFGTLRIRIDGRRRPVTELRALSPGTKRKRSFVTADGVTVRATRFRQLPYWLYRILHKK